MKKNNKKNIEVSENIKNKTRKKRRKLKKLNFIKLILILGILILLGILFYFAYNKNKIQSIYSNYMKTTTNKIVYKKENNKYIKIGTIYKNNIVSLSNIEGDYFKLKDNDYYITYKDLTKSKNKEEVSYNSILFNENIVTKKNAIIYKNEKKYLKIKEELELKILEKSKDFYTCIYNKEIVQVKKDDINEFKKVKNSDIETITSMPVIYFDKTANIEEFIKILNDKKYITITKDEYNKWLEENILFAKNTVFIVLQEESSEFQNILKKYNINYTLEKDLELNFVENDAFSSKDKLYWYKINKFTTIERFNDIFEGKQLDSSEYATSIAVLNYHFFYTTDGECDEVIALKKDKFEEQMKYLQDNNYKSLTMDEYNKWLKGEIEVPKKSVLLTVDDGALGTDTILPDVLDKYNQKATLFLITSFWPMSKYRTGNLEIQSHSHSLHDRNFCNNGNCGIKTLVLDKESIRNDIKKSLDIIGNEPIAYCYPFYIHDEKTIEVVKEMFQVAFVGGNRKSKRTDNNYLIPRYVILNDITLDDFIEMIS
ncbi:MAG: polysaccharide deacetylase family protein [Bacilli bacterium]